MEDAKIIDKDKLMLESLINARVHEGLFGQWLREFFLLNDELNKEYNRIYQKYFYVVFYELTTSGIIFTDEVLHHLRSKKNLEKFEFYTALNRGIKDLRDLFNENEFQYIEYLRHSSSHIFQSHYEYRIDNIGKIHTKRKEKSIDKIDEELRSIFVQHENDKGFDQYMTKKLYPKIVSLRNQLDKIKKTSHNIT